MVISATKIALADGSLMTRLLSGTPWRMAPGRRPTISSGSLAMLAASALYQVIRAEAGPESGDDEIPCRVCGAPLAPRDGELSCGIFCCGKRVANRSGKSVGPFVLLAPDPRQRRPPHRRQCRSCCGTRSRKLAARSSDDSPKM